MPRPCQRTAAAPAGRRGGEEAVSPVIGTVLVLAISVVGVVAVSQWALPAIQEMKVNSDTTAVLNEFRNLDSSIQKLIAGTSSQTSFKWQPTIGTGAVDVRSGGSRWLATADVSPAHNVTWTDVSEIQSPDNDLTIRSNQTIGTASVKAWRWTGGSKVELRVVDTSGGCTAFTGGIPADTDQTLYLKTNQTLGCTAVNIDDGVFTFAVYDGSSLIHEAYLVDTGHVHWNSLIGSRGPRHVYSINGGVASGPTDDLVLQSPLAVPPQRSFTNATGSETLSTFVRFVRLDGNASFSPAGDGVQRYAIYLNLVGTWELGEQDVVHNTAIYVWGPMRAAAYRGLTDAVDGYRYVEVENPDTGERYLYHRDDSKSVQYAAMYSLLQVEG